ncbi:alpha/beta hydrolase [Allonocardiopsis opalescens]|uniref:Serine aminopeptidase S33 domain-containing protein n=1 Tax=Allonocardiopsis opalescens TaxID=1144618 RepID=A0A2T0PZW4_9ACTN|nr:alpha/beta hydrolase [Allonocardiopsis opalescens]PRX97080.1 hypothetical protein CLV72_106116 [Allonocardiopsis opalescens]
MTQRVQTEPISFTSESATLVGTLYRPADRTGEPLPASAVAGSWTTVKEQMAGRYARGLAERGQAALAFDFRGYGESGGEPRDVESAALKVRDLRSAVAYLAGRDDVDASRLGVLGVCAGAGYAAVAATEEPRIRSLALVAPWLHDARLVREVYGGESGVRERVDAGLAAESRYRETGEVDYVPAVSETDPAAAMYGPITYYLDPRRGRIAAWSNRFAVMAWPEWLGFDPIQAAPHVDVPTLVVHSDDAAVPDGARRFVAQLAGPATAHWTQGTQFDFYDRDATVDAALDLAAPHLAAPDRAAPGAAR